MAIRFNTSGQDYFRTMALGSTSQWSITCWAKITTDLNDFSTVWSLDNGSSAFYVLETQSDGTTMTIADGATVFQSRALTVGKWYFFGVSVNGANGTWVTRAIDDSSFTVQTWSTGTTQNIQTIEIGDSVFGGESLNGAISAFKFWTGATLTSDEMQLEAWTNMPRRTTNLKAWWPFNSGSLVDYSGNAQTLSGGGGPVEDGPVPWSTQPPIIVIQGTLDATASPSAVAAVAAVPSPTISTGSGVSPSAVAAVASVPAPTVSTGSSVSPGTVSAVVAIPTPTVTTGAVTSVSPGVVSVVATVPAPSVSAGAIVAASTLTALVAVPAPALSTGAVVAVETVAVAVRIPLPSITVPILPGDLITGDWQIEVNTELLLGPQTYRIISVSGWDDLVDLDVGDVMRPSRHGAWPGRKLAQERLLSANIVVDDQDTFLESLQALRRATAVPDDDAEIPIVVRTRGETLIAYGAIDARLLPPDTWYAGVAQGALRWRCSDPRRYSLQVGSIVISNGQTDIAENEGDTLSHPLVRIAGPATNPSIYNQSTDRTLAFTVTLGSNDTLVVDTNAGTVRVGSADRMSALSPLSVPVEEWFLQMGTNAVSYSATSGGSAGVEVQWRSAFL